ncbi:MAG: trypsin-like peptidase domain-containing protein [Dehalococcoidales bacterium]|nr:trypsin-like peptidase domain-containing protein [Dehalococcoidales bacterium]
MKKVNPKYLLVSLILSLSLILSTGCVFTLHWGQIPSNPPPQPVPTAPVTPTTPPITPIAPDWVSPPSTNNPPLPDFISVVEKVKPSVVVIKSEGGAGSGWIIRQDGIIITNNHVVAGGNTIAITLNDGRSFQAEKVYADPLTDLAVIKIDAQNLPAADIGDSANLKVGEWVLAIGNSLDLGVTPSEGIIRSLGNSVPVSGGQMLEGLIETSAAINPGNSGGPLVNMAGEVVGITSIKIASVEVEGMGYAISINTAKGIIDQLITRGYVIRPYLGVALADVTPAVAFWYDLPVDKGALITLVAPDSPAAQAGLKKGDIVVGMDDEKIITAQDLIKGIHTRQIGQSVKLTYWREDTSYTTQATLIEKPPPS